MKFFGSHVRVKYEKSPLVEALCQVRYQRVLSIDINLPSEFQERIDAQYPVLSAIERGIRAGEESSKLQTAFEFGSEGGHWKVTLTSEFIALSTNKYSDWEEFSERLDHVLSAFSEAYGERRVTRIGLRYKNVILPSHLGVSGEPWNALLRSSLLGLLSEGNVENVAFDNASVVEEDDLKACLKSSLIEVTSEEKHEDAALIDIDCWREKNVPCDREKIIKTFDSLNRVANSAFRWSITNRLHESLSPRPITAL